MYQKSKNTNWLYLVVFIIGIAIVNYFSNDYANKKYRFPVESNLTLQENQTVKISDVDVDSLLVVVDSLKVQRDSMHLQLSKPPDIIYLKSKVDTAAVIENYFRTYTYKISHKDEKINLQVNFKYSQNKLFDQELQYQVLQPTKITVRPIKGWFYGGTIGGSIDRMHQITPELMYIVNNQAFKLGYNLLGSKINFQLGYYRKF